MGKIAVEIGNHAYLWKDEDGYADSVVISAHGHYTKKTSTVNNPSSTLVFYCEHGSTVDALPQATNLSAHRPVESVLPGHPVLDYELSKYQEHGKDLKKLAKAQGWTFEEAESEAGSSFAAGETYATFRNYGRSDPDFITVRHRRYVPWTSSVSLSSLLQELEQIHSYASIRCCFCRELQS